MLTSDVGILFGKCPISDAYVQPCCLANFFTFLILSSGATLILNTLQAVMSCMTVAKTCPKTFIYDFLFREEVANKTEKLLYNTDIAQMVRGVSMNHCQCQKIPALLCMRFISPTNHP